MLFIWPVFDLGDFVVVVVEQLQATGSDRISVCTMHQQHDSATSRKKLLKLIARMVR